MRLIPKLGLLAVVALMAACMFAPNASASWTCTGGRATCIVTATATVVDTSRSGSTGTTFVTAGGLATLSCDDSTISTDDRGAFVARSGTSSITFTGAGVDFKTNCRINIDAGCTVVPAVTAGNSDWTLTLSQPSGPGPSHSVRESIGEVRITLRTCRVAGNNGILTIPSQDLGTRCGTYTSTTGILTSARCPVRYTSTVPNLPAGTASFSGSYHLLIDGTVLSPAVSSGA